MSTASSADPLLSSSLLSSASNLQPYSISPPPFLAPFSDNLRLGYPSFTPPVAGQDEDDASKDIVANGYVRQTTSTSEGFSAHGMVDSKVDVPFLARLFESVEAKRRQKVGEIPKTTFKLPSKITLNEQKRESWLLELANPSIPLLKLSKTLPHGFKGEKLLSSFLIKNVPLDRAMWFIRLHTLTELKKGKGGTLMQEKIVIDWTREVGEWMRKVLAEITMPAVGGSVTGEREREKEGTNVVGRLGGRSGVTVKSKAKHLLVQKEDDGREKWKIKWIYITNLVNKLVGENLVDMSMILESMIHNINHANIPQLPFVLQFLQPNLSTVGDNESLARGVVYSCLRRLQQIESLSDESGRIKPMLINTLRLFIRTLFLLCPDAFANKGLWTSQKDRILDVLFEKTEEEEEVEENVKELMEEDWERIHARVGDGEDDTWREREKKLVQALDGFSMGTDMDAFFDLFFGPQIPVSSQEINLLLTWSLTPHRIHPLRRYLVSTLLSRLPSSHSHEYLKSFLVRANYDIQTILLIGELIKRHVLELGKFTSMRSAALRDIFKCIPLYGGHNARDAVRSLEVFLPEEEFKRAREGVEKEVKEVRAWLRGALPNIFGAPSWLGREKGSRESADALIKKLKNGNPAAAAKALWATMFPEVKKAVLPASPSEDGPVKVVMAIDDFIILMECGYAVEDYRWILEVLLFFLKHPPDERFVQLATAILDANLLTFKAMNESARITSALIESFRFWKARKKIHRNTVRLLQRLGEDSSEVKEIVTTTYMTATTFANQIMPPHLPDIATLAEGGEINLAQELRLKYGAYEFWGQTVWQNVVDGVLSFTFDTLDPNKVEVYATFLEEIDWRLIGGLTPVILNWFKLDPDFTSAHPLAQSRSNQLVQLLVQLVHRCVISVKDLVKDVILPTWNDIVDMYSLFSSASFDDSDCTILRNLCLLTAELLVTHPPSYLYQCRIVAGRNEYYEKDNAGVAILASKLVTAQSLCRSAGRLELSETMDRFRRELIHDQTFLTSFKTNVDACAQPLLNPQSVDGQDLRPTCFEALQEICDGHSLDIANFDWDSIFAHPSVWGVSLMSISLQVKLELIAKGNTPSPQDMDPRYAAAKSLLSRMIDDQVDGPILEQLLPNLPFEVSQHVAILCLGSMLDSEQPPARAHQLERILSLLVRTGTSRPPRAYLVSPSETVLSSFLQDWQSKMSHWTLNLDVERFGQKVKVHLDKLVLVNRCGQLWGSTSGKVLNSCLADMYKWVNACSLESQPSDPHLFDHLVDSIHSVLQDASPALRSHAINSIGVEYNALKDQPRPFSLSEHHYTRITGIFPISIYGAFIRYRTSLDGDTLTGENSVTPWDLVANLELTNRLETQSSPTPAHNPTFINNGSIELSLFGAEKIEPNQAMAARSIEGAPNTRKGLQQNFDFEISLRSQPSWARDFRRSRLPMSPPQGHKKYVGGERAELGKRKQAPKAVNEVLNPEVLIGSKTSTQQRRVSTATSKNKRKR